MIGLESDKYRTAMCYSFVRLACADGKTFNLPQHREQGLLVAWKVKQMSFLGRWQSSRSWKQWSPNAMHWSGILGENRSRPQVRSKSDLPFTSPHGSSLCDRPRWGAPQSPGYYFVDRVGRPQSTKHDDSSAGPAWPLVGISPFGFE